MTCKDNLSKKTDSPNYQFKKKYAPLSPSLPITCNAEDALFQSAL
jgi:hypothetical protein